MITTRMLCSALKDAKTRLEAARKRYHALVDGRKGMRYDQPVVQSSPDGSAVEETAITLAELSAMIERFQDEYKDARNALTRRIAKERFLTKRIILLRFDGLLTYEKIADVVIQDWFVETGKLPTAEAVRTRVRNAQDRLDAIERNSEKSP